ncbi:hypothetical protein HDU83_008169 [Entophlyctis luteolus]|nr:hypothetical protein HDU82_004560 [Entophlyctis luteolus]KAJ3338413.1 hypothetical protein HDU83_008169 [Entophlyctis luteolus]
MAGIFARRTDSADTHANTLASRKRKLESTPAVLLQRRHSTNTWGPAALELSAPTTLRPRQYAVISHVWGRTVGPVELPSLEGHTFLLSSRDKADLVKVACTQITDFPVWMDVVSIDQNNEASKVAQVAIMAEIYEFAACMIILLDPSDSDILLNAVALSNSAEPSPLAAGADPEEIAGKVLRILNMEYFTRVWTLQEWVLCPDYIFLCSDGSLVGPDDLARLLSWIAGDATAGCDESTQIMWGMALTAYVDILGVLLTAGAAYDVAVRGNDRRRRQFRTRNMLSLRDRRAKEADNLIRVLLQQARFCSQPQDVVFGSRAITRVLMDVPYRTDRVDELLDEYLAALMRRGLVAPTAASDAQSWRCGTLVKVTSDDGATVLGYSMIHAVGVMIPLSLWDTDNDERDHRFVARTPQPETVLVVGDLREDRRIELSGPAVIVAWRMDLFGGGVGGALGSDRNPSNSEWSKWGLGPCVALGALDNFCVTACTVAVDGDDTEHNALAILPAGKATAWTIAMGGGIRGLRSGRTETAALMRVVTGRNYFLLLQATEDGEFMVGSLVFEDSDIGSRLLTPKTMSVVLGPLHK